MATEGRRLLLRPESGTSTTKRSSPPVRCAVSGSVTYRKDKDRPSYRDVEVTLEGFDRRTGNRTWSVPTSRAGALELVKGESAIVMVDAAAVQTPSGRTTVSLVDGETFGDRRAADRSCVKAKALTVRYAIALGGTHQARRWAPPLPLYGRRQASPGRRADE